NDFTQLLWSSYFGGTKNDACNSVKLDGNGNVFIAGGTSSNNLTNTTGAYSPTYNGGESDGFLAKISSNGQMLLQTTYIGENLYDQAFFVELDENDKVYTVGQSAGGNFFVHPQSYSNAGSSQFVAKLNNDLTALERSTVFGTGSANIDISPSAFLVDVCGNIYVSGWGANILQTSPIGNMPTTSNAFQSSAPNGFDFYLVVFERDLEGLLYGTYIGGSQANEHVDGGTSRFDKNGVVYQSVCAGCGGVSDFPTTTDAWSSQNLANNCNNLVFKFDFELIPKAEFFVDMELGCAPFTVDFSNFSTSDDDFVWDFGNGNLDSTTFEPSILYDTPGTYDVFLYVTDTVCLITDTAQVTITVDEPIQLDMPADVALCSPEELTFIPNTFGTANQFVWSSNLNFSDTLNDDLTDSVLIVNPSTDQSYYLSVGDGACNTIDSVQVMFTSAAMELTGDINLCKDEVGSFNVQSLDPNLTLSNFDWSPDSVIVSGEGTNEIDAQFTTSQYVYVEVDVSNGCHLYDSIWVNVSFIAASDVLAIASDTIVPSGTAVNLSALPNGNYNYSWSPTGGISDPNQQNLTVEIFEDITYTVSVSDGICTRTDDVVLKAFTYVCGEPFVFVPNAFSPDGDGENDILFVRSNIVSELTFKVFDRWGELVFESNDITRGWDGTFQGKLLDPDTYDYYLEAYCIDGSQEIIKGNITLIR
ncbi:gliding motility-associated C-terminal domain-containing protein, partial [Lishizhenia sp.]|uniref:T9SS type B sorting domain-containing protein n=1 Tax=Lishizhenia sp. TaxID=2497594 RepID=UPI00299E0A3C